MRVIDNITPLLLDSRLFDDPEKIKHAKNPYKKKKNLTQFGLKIGQGGTLDPLADGVLVIGVNRGTKHLNQFLECSKVSFGSRLSQSELMSPRSTRVWVCWERQRRRWIPRERSWLLATLTM